MRKTAWAAITFAAISYHTSSFAGYDEARAAWSSGDYTAALKELQPLADAGDARSQNLLGVLYDKGLGVPQDRKQAVYWYSKAAMQGDRNGMYNLGAAYDEGFGGLTQDYLKAASWYRNAAEAGHPEAQYNLGLLYERGRGVAPDQYSAARWYHRAAEYGIPPAQINLGTMYRNGRGVARDYVMAYVLWSLAANSGLTVAVDDIRDLDSLLTPAQLSEARQLIDSWRPGVHLPERSRTWQAEPGTGRNFVPHSPLLCHDRALIPQLLRRAGAASG
jgi:hypothetical protein